MWLYIIKALSQRFVKLSAKDAVGELRDLN